ncbi:MAG TPA: serine/threonine-protein kinase [Myxococcus sp.]|nr:serine/threonine-protein kinase [Myxococcus sp.]
MECPDVETWEGWSQGKGTPEERGRLQGHLDGCARCQTARSGGGATAGDETGASEPAAGLGSRPLPRGTSVGRYVVLERVGAGGMGVVYAAYDPKLDRKVALKLVRPDKGSAQPADVRQQRLLREAQALARLAHSNVVSVHDTGSFLDQVFLAMEFVDGGTVREWLRASPRAWRETLHLFLQAGRGLATAHAAGLAHRDFKPDNVLIGRDGRVKVTDFGLARPVAGTPEAPAASPAPAPGMTSTGAGLVPGTPGYQAPEVLAGSPADAHGDQFAFCVSLHEALYGFRPHEAPPPRDTKVPAWVRRVLLRGLSASPAERYPSMDALLRELGQDPGAARTRRLAVAVGGLAVLAVAGYTPYQRWRAQRACVEAASPAHLWSEADTQAVAGAFTALGRPYAAEAWARTRPVLDAYAAAWSEQARDTCEATRVRGEQPEAEHQQRGACLERRRDELRALVDLLARADEEVAGNAVQAAKALSPIAQCGPLPQATPRAPEAADPELRAGLARLKVMSSAGRYAQGVEAAKALVARLPPGTALHAEALLWLGRLRGSAGDAGAAEQHLQEALLTAERSAQRELEAAARIQLVQVVGGQQDRFEEAERHARHAEAVLASLNHPAPLERELALHVSRMLWRAGRSAAALTKLDATLARQRVELGPEHLEVAQTLSLVSTVQKELSHFQEAHEAASRSLEVLEKQLGPEHPQVAAALHTLGTSAHSLDDLASARGLLERALAAREKSLGLEHPLTAASANNLAVVKMTLGEHEPARQLLLRALAIHERTSGPEHAEVGRTLNALGVLAFMLHEDEAALGYFQRSLAIKEKALGAAHPSLSIAICNIGILLHRMGRDVEAWEWHRRALELRVKAFGEKHNVVAFSLTFMGRVLHSRGKLAEAWEHHRKAAAIYAALGQEKSEEAALPLAGLGEVELARGRATEAVALFERALAVASAGTVPAPEAVDVRFGLARALAAAGRKEASLTEAEKARGDYEKLGAAGRHGLEALRRWRERQGHRSTVAGHSP